LLVGTRLLTSAAKKQTVARKTTSDVLKYYNRVRKYLDKDWKDFSRQNLNDRNHIIWLNNSIGQKDNILYRAFQTWSYIMRGREELQIVFDDIEGLLKWLDLECETALGLWNSSANTSEQMYRAQRYYSIENRRSCWGSTLRRLQNEIVVEQTKNA
jgi:hypothetical protein